MNCQNILMQGFVGGREGVIVPLSYQRICLAKTVAELLSRLVFETETFDKLYSTENPLENVS